MNSDRLIGSGILIAVIIVAILYFGSFIIPWWSFLTAVKIVVSVGFLALLGIGGWIGWTMATTPSPEPVEDIETEDIGEFEEEEFEEEEEVVEATPEAKSLDEAKDELLSINGMTENRLESLRDEGYDTLDSLQEATEEDLKEVKGIGDKLAGRIKEELSQ